MARAWRNLYVFLMVAWFGVMVYYTGILTPTLTRAFPDDFGTIVGALFPGYFRLGEVLAFTAALAALMEFRSHRGEQAHQGVPAGGTGLAGRTGPGSGPGPTPATAGTGSAANTADAGPGGDAGSGAPRDPARTVLAPGYGAPGSGWRLAAGLAALALVAANRELVLPAAHAARGTAAFGPLHGISMAINLLTATLALFGAVSGLLAPAAAGRRRTAGRAG